MKKLWLMFALLLPLAGCPKKTDNKKPDGQPTTTPADPDKDDTSGGPTPPASNRAVPSTPSH